MEELNMKLSIDELSEMSAFKALWECNKDHLDEVAITIKADTNVEDPNKKPLVTVITYRTLFKNILKTYDSLKRKGVKRGDTVTYASITTPEFIYTMYAANLLQAIFDPIDPRSNGDELVEHFENEPSKIYFAPERMINSTKEVYKDIKVDSIVTTSFTESLPLPVRIGAKVLDRINGVKGYNNPDERIFCNFNEFMAGSKIERGIKFPKYERDLVASFAHTTGSTGKPKAIIHTNENWNAQLWSISNSKLDFKRGEKLFNVTAPWVDFGIVNVIHTFLCNGIRMDLDPLWTPETTVDFYLKNRDEWWLGAPGWIDPLFTNPKYDNSDVSFGKYIITGGGPLFEHKQRLYVKRLRNDFNSWCIVVQGYGLSEATAAVLIDTENNPGYIGYTMPGFKTVVKDPVTLETLKPEEVGELWIAAKYPNLSPIAKGYLGLPEETAKTFVIDETGEVWVRSGDKTIQKEDGLTKWHSRYKNTLTFNGFNIDLDKLLDYVENVPSVKRGAIIGAVTADGNQRPLVCIELKDDILANNANEIKDDIKEMIKNKLPEYYEPLDIIIYEQLPEKTMKINYTAIKEDLLNENGEYVPSLTLIRKKD